MSWMSCARTALLFIAVSAQPPPLRSFTAAPQAVVSCWRDARPRTPHGFPGISAAECADAGSCFDPTYADQPWCFYPNATPSSWAAPGPVQRFAGSQAAPALASRVGSAHASETGDVAGVSCLSAPPLAQACDVLSGGAALPWPAPAGAARFAHFPPLLGAAVGAALHTLGDLLTQWERREEEGSRARVDAALLLGAAAAQLQPGSGGAAAADPAAADARVRYMARSLVGAAAAATHIGSAGFALDEACDELAAQ